MPSVPPIGNKPPSHPPEPNKSHATPSQANTSATDAQSASASPPVSGGGGGGMTAFLDMFTPEEKKKFMNILIQNLTRSIQKESKKIVEELKKERQRIEGGGDDS